MQTKQATVFVNGSPIRFFFPSIFSNESIIQAIKIIRSGSRSNWKREFLDLEIEIVVVNSISIEYEFKYIVVTDKNVDNCRRYMFVFPKSINHDFMFEAVQRLIMLSDFEGHNPRNISSAGFVTSSGKCHGKSETLNIGSLSFDNLSLC